MCSIHKFMNLLRSYNCMYCIHLKVFWLNYVKNYLQVQYIINWAFQFYYHKCFLYFLF